MELQKMLLDALVGLQKEIHSHHKMNIKKDISLLTADAKASTAIAVARVVAGAGQCKPCSEAVAIEAIEQSMERLGLSLTGSAKATAIAGMMAV